MGLVEEIQELKNLIKEDKLKESEKKWRFPFGKKVGRGQKKKNFVTVMILNDNGIYDFKKYKIEDQTILHDMIPRLATAGYVMFNKKGNPLIILPSWSVEPFSPRVNLEESLQNGMNIKGFKILMAKMLKEQVTDKPKMGGAWKWVIGIALAAIIGYAFITGGK